MTRDELADQIRTLICDTPMWEKIEAGRTSLQCKEMSFGVYDKLNNAIPGLSIAVVTNDYELTDHAWLAAYHPGTGYFMIDPTAGQFIKNTSTDLPYNDVFIGTYYDLEKMLASNEYELRYSGSVHTTWSPVLCFQKPGYYKPEEVELWKHYEFPVSETTGTDREGKSEAELTGRWVARMEEAGFNWRRVLMERYQHAPQYNPLLKPRVADEIINVRNDQLQLGIDRDGTSFQNKLGKDYAKDKPRQP